MRPPVTNRSFVRQATGPCRAPGAGPPAWRSARRAPACGTHAPPPDHAYPFPQGKGHAEFHHPSPPRWLPYGLAETNETLRRLQVGDILLGKPLGIAADLRV